MNNPRKDQGLPVVFPAPKPGDFPLGSAESRAAARMAAEIRQDTRERLEFVSHIPRPWRGEGPEPPDWNKVPRTGPWQDVGGMLLRCAWKPPA
jgi:hypothetical protein